MHSPTTAAERRQHRADVERDRYHEQAALHARDISGLLDTAAPDRRPRQRDIVMHPPEVRYYTKYTDGLH